MKYDDQFPIRQQMKEPNDDGYSLVEKFLMIFIVAIVAVIVIRQFDRVRDSREPQTQTLILPQEPEVVTLTPVRKTRVAEIGYEGE